MNHNLGRVAIVADQMTAFGGADREIISLLELIPDADIYTVLFNPKGYPNVDIKQKIYTSFAQKLPFKYKFSRHLKVLNPILYESFDLREYDTIISLSAGPGKSIIPGIEQIHIAMVMTPPRSLWDYELNVRSSLLQNIYKPISKVLNNYLRIWDTSLVPRVDYWTANSKFIAKKIEKRYGVKASVIYPGIKEECFEKIETEEKERIIEKYNLPKDFILAVSRLYDHKRVDWAINSAIDTGENLIIVGDGPDKKYLKKMSKGHENIIFLGFLENDKEVRILYNLSKLLLFCAIEDFGLVPVEAMAQGTPIFAFSKGGVTETVLENKCGKFFNNNEELTQLLKDFDKKAYNAKEIVNRAKDFTEEKFLQNLTQYFKKVNEEQQK
jgi:glycosyltransferase involved in cell wall biosynthesis